MKKQLSQEQTIVDYLLGKLPPEEEHRFAEQYFADDRLFDRLQNVENDLLDLYARGRMDQEERAGFERYLAIHPQGKYKVALATSLMQLSQAERRESESALQREAPLSWLDSLLGSQQQQNLVLRLGLAASVAIIAFSATYMVYQHRQVIKARNEIIELRNSEVALKQKIAEQEVTIAKSKRDEQESQLPPQTNQIVQTPLPSQSPTPRSPGVIIAQLLFTLPLRGVAGAEELQLMPNTKSVSVTIILDDTETYSRYLAKVESVSGASVNTPRYLAAKKVRSRRILEFIITDPKRLTESDYKIYITAIDEAGREISNATRTLTFKIARKQQ